MKIRTAEDAGTVDWEVRALVLRLNEAGLETDWSCSGEAGHMVIRPTIQMRSQGDMRTADGLARLTEERERIEGVLDEFGIGDGWLLLNLARGRYDTHGGEPTWILMVPGRFDLTTALPAAYSAEFHGDDNVTPGYAPPCLPERALAPAD